MIETIQYSESYFYKTKVLNILLVCLCFSSVNIANSSELGSVVMAGSPWEPWRIKLADKSWGGIAIDTTMVIAQCTNTKLVILDVINNKRMLKEWGLDLSNKRHTSAS